MPATSRGMPSGGLLMPSVFDRLFDDEARSPAAAEPPARHDLQGFVRCIARDLEWLLNTRCIDIDEHLERFPLAHGSVLGYGTLDMCSLSMRNPDDRARLRDQIRLTIECHEPRLQQVRIDLEMPSDTGPRALRFRVDAVLAVHPERPPVAFDALLQVSSSDFRVRGG